MSQQIDPQRIYRVEEVAAWLGVPPHQVRQWLREGRLQGVRIGQRWIVQGSQILRLQASWRS